MPTILLPEGGSCEDWPRFPSPLFFGHSPKSAGSTYIAKGKKNMWQWEKFVVFSSSENDKVWRVPYSEFASAPDEYIARAKADGLQLWEHEQVYVPPTPNERPSKQ